MLKMYQSSMIITVVPNLGKLKTLTKAKVSQRYLKQSVRHLKGTSLHRKSPRKNLKLLKLKILKEIRLRRVKNVCERNEMLLYKNGNRKENRN